jgi:hypothetical protein
MVYTIVLTRLKWLAVQNAKSGGVTISSIGHEGSVGLSVCKVHIYSTRGVFSPELQLPYVSVGLHQFR